MARVTQTERGHNNSEDLDLINPATDTVSVVLESIQKDLTEVLPLPFNCSIYHVPKPLHEIKPEAFTPRLVSIGPFHRYKEHLQPMEAHKLRYLNNILQRESRVTLRDYVKAMSQVEDRTRKCYSEIIQLNSEDFVKMMLLDGCFILELILKYTVSLRSKHPTNHLPKITIKHPNDPIFNMTWMLRVISHDLILLENQLPFLVLERLFNLFENYSGVGSLTFIDLLHCFFEYYITVPQTTIIKSSRLQILVWRKGDIEESRDKGKEIGEYSQDNHKAKHLLEFIRLSLLPPSLSQSSRTTKNFGVIFDFRSATELYEAGVKFEKGPTTSLLDITFSNRVLKIPTMKIYDSTESLFRNLIAYEQCLDYCSNEITTYAAFINGLINSPKDVELLQKKGIIVNMLGGPEEVSTLFNNLLKEVNILPNDYFSDVFGEMDKYYKIRWHKWKANLMHNYFNTPWAFISVFVAVFLLILSGIQTICSIIAI
ncbi:hypothetical protein NE237_026505 [Protea cynaroides]|uniref:Uncharacterized protein n=1 Tax=Protea cynaroides TaxID=273540 RepID=A0A9Q0H926_9MAGN|nr:hypothetical protein NE237_026505 [Protea cynaroides]